MFFASALLVLSTLAVAAPDWSTHSPLTHAPVVPSSCGWWSCPRDASFERALEEEFWGHLQREDFEGMSAWIGKTEHYVGRALVGRGLTGAEGRLSMLLSGAHTMLAATADMEGLAELAQSVRHRDVVAALKGLAAHAREAGAVHHVVVGLAWAKRARALLGDSSNGATFLFFETAFLQMALPPIEGITGAAAAEHTLLGPTCGRFPTWLTGLVPDFCSERGLMGPTPSSAAACVDVATCESVGAGHGEGIVAAATLLALASDGQHPERAARALALLGDGPGDDDVALCETFPCRNTIPNDPSADLPEATSIAPFKRIVELLNIAELYARAGARPKMERALDEARAEAVRLRWPFTSTLDDVTAALHGGDAARGIPDAVAQWAHPQPSTRLGEIALPMPISNRHGCRDCHFGGVMNAHVRY